MERVAIGDLWQFKFPGNVNFSPEGEKVAFTLKTPREKENDYQSRIWIYEMDKDRSWPLTAGPKDGPFIWLDENTILFISQRTEKDKQEEKEKVETELYRIRIDGGEAELIDRVSLKITGLKKSKAGELIFSGQKEEEKKEEQGEVEVLEELPFWQNGQGLISGKRTHLFRYHLDLKKLEPLTSGSFQVTDFDVAQGRVIFTRQEFGEKLELTASVCLYDLEKGEVIQKTPGDELNVSFVRFIDENRAIFGATDMEAMGLGTNRELYGFDLVSGTYEQLTDMDKSLGVTLGTDVRLDGGNQFVAEKNSLFFLATEGSQVRLWKWDEGELEKVIDIPGGIDCFDISSGDICYVALRGTDLPELYLWREGEEKRLTAFNQDYMAEKTITAPEPFPVKTDDGREIQAWIIKPADFNPGGRYPLILEIHGGPKTIYGPVFFHEMQALAAAGWAVVFSNPRGSDGRGNEFADIRGGYGQRDYRDLMEVVDTALEKFPWLDENRLGVAGGSYGGFMTNWIIGHTDRFRAGVSQRSIANWVSMHGTTDIGFFFVPDQVGADPWSDVDKLWKHSPLAYADRVKTPTLFIHAEEDYRCWLVESLQMFTALKIRGVPAKTCIFKGENHELSRSGKPKNRIRRLEEMKKWFTEYL